jgi:hypothetical protein
MSEKKNTSTLAQRELISVRNIIMLRSSHTATRQKEKKAFFDWQSSHTAWKDAVTGMCNMSKMRKQFVSG